MWVSRDHFRASIARFVFCKFFSLIWPYMWLQASRLLLEMKWTFVFLISVHLLLLSMVLVVVAQTGTESIKGQSDSWRLKSIVWTFASSEPESSNSEPATKRTTQWPKAIEEGSFGRLFFAKEDPYCSHPNSFPTAGKSTGLGSDGYVSELRKNCKEKNIVGACQVLEVVLPMHSCWICMIFTFEFEQVHGIPLKDEL
jgi:hypothetical protein